MDGWIDRWIDGWINGWMDVFVRHDGIDPFNTFEMLIIITTRALSYFKDSAI